NLYLLRPRTPRKDLHRGGDNGAHAGLRSDLRHPHPVLTERISSRDFPASSGCASRGRTAWRPVLFARRSWSRSARIAADASLVAIADVAAQPVLVTLAVRIGRGPREKDRGRRRRRNLRGAVHVPVRVAMMGLPVADGFARQDWNRKNGCKDNAQRD